MNGIPDQYHYKKDGTLRLCIDFQSLNRITIKNTYPIPLIENVFDKLGGSCIFTSLDATSGYHQIAIHFQDIPKTAFSWNRRQYEFERMPFGLCNAPLTFQRVMDQILKDEEDVCVYLNDVIVKSKTVEEHKITLERVLGKLKAAGIILNLRKCKLFCIEIKILGYLIKENKIFPDKDKLEFIKKIEKPSTINQLRSILGLFIYHRSFIKNFALISAPLYDILIGETKTVKGKYNGIVNKIKHSVHLKHVSHATSIGICLI